MQNLIQAAAFVFLADAQADGCVDDLQQDPGGYRAPGGRRQDAERLNAELVQAADSGTKRPFGRGG